MADIPRLLSGRPVLPPLSGKQEEVLLWFIQYSEEHGYFPVLRETALHFGITVARVQGLMGQLEKRGYIIKTAASSRNIQFTELTRGWVERKKERDEAAQQTLGFSSS